MSIGRRLRKLEEHTAPEETPEEVEKRRKEIREQGEHINHCRDRGTPPLFEIAQNGDVLCAYDGKLVTDWHQTGAEQFYWMEVGWGGPGLIHDKEAEAFYTPDGKLAVSRTRFDLRHLMGESRG
jgi:hypothetical protein